MVSQLKSKKQQATYATSYFFEGKGAEELRQKAAQFVCKAKLMKKTIDLLLSCGNDQKA